MSRKRKNYIRPDEAIKFLKEAYGLKAIEFKNNGYQLRITHPEVTTVFFDWYHTTGKLVINRDGQSAGLGVFLDDESVALEINRALNK